jgi:1-acyl-sn-glycerol-3-phosphate acyltransferase
MTGSPLEGLTKAELLELARRRDIRGRSRMTKADLLAALGAAAAATPNTSPEEPEPSGRRAALNERLAAMVDPGRHCTWRSPDGDPCGLPVVRGAGTCGLHGGIDGFDVAMAATGRLGFDAWPALLRQLRMASYDCDPIGLDPVVAELVWHLLNFLYFDYFHVEVEGIEHVPPHGPALLVANHGGAALPYDGAMLSLAVANEAERPRRVRVMGTEIFNMLPVVSHLFRKVGGAYASRDDASFLLAAGRLLAVFPEGDRGFQKPLSEAYQVQRFGRGGFITMAEQHSAPVVPVAILGSEEVHPAWWSSRTLARLVRLIWPQQRVETMGVVLNPIPLPVRWRIKFLPAVLPAHPGEEPDPLEMLERTEQIRGTIQDTLDRMIAARTTLF